MFFYKSKSRLLKESTYKFSSSFFSYLTAFKNPQTPITTAIPQEINDPQNNILPSFLLHLLKCRKPFS